MKTKRTKVFSLGFSKLAVLSILFFTMPALALQPTEIFEINKKSVGLVKTKDGLGSGVVIDKEIVLTNCHVVAGQDNFEYIQGSLSFPAVLVAGNTALDLCKIRVPGLSAKPAKIRDLSDIKIGERVYAIGNPRGLELTISEGLISGLRDFEDFVVLQTTAPISPGSSGGGLFDTSGRLVGITTSMLKNSQNINFAVPAKFAQNLKPMTSAAAVPNETVVVTPLSSLLRDAKKGDANAQYALANRYFEAKDYKEAVKWFGLAAKQGHGHAQSSLGIAYEYGWGVAQDYKEAAKWFRLAAEQGDKSSQNTLGEMYSKGQGVAQDYKEAAKWFRLAAEQDDAEAQSALGEMYAKGQGVEKDYKEALKWLRLAAKRPYAAGKALYNLGIMYSKGQGVLQDYEEAYNYFRHSALSYAPARCILAEIYVLGLGTDKNMSEAKRLAKEGYNAGEEYCKEVWEKYHLANY